MKILAKACSSKAMGGVRPAVTKFKRPANDSKRCNNAADCEIEDSLLQKMS